MNRFIFLIVAMLLIAGCNSSEESSAFSAILDQPPYKPITDSIKREPKKDELYFRRAVLLNKNNYPEPALADFQKAWSLKKEEVYAVGISNILFQKSMKGASDFLEQATRDIPSSIYLKLSLAKAYNAQDKTDQALALTRSILQEQPDQVNTMLLEYDLLQKKGDSVNSIKTLEKARLLVPDNREINYKLAFQYAESKDPKAIALTDTLIKMDSLKLFAEPYYVRGLYYSNIKDRAKALQWFNETIKLHYNFLDAYIEKGKVLFDQKQIGEALKTFQLAIRIKPSFPDAWYWLGRCQEQMGQKAEAKENYEKAYGLDKTFVEAKEAADAIK